MKQLAILGHLTRGEEVIEILEMLGGKQFESYNGNDINWCYTIIDGSIDWDYPSDKYKVFSIEEFFEKFPYKVGDKVLYKIYGIHSKIKSMLWNKEKEQVFYRLESNKLFVATADELKPIYPYKEETMEEKVESFEILESHCADEVKIEFDPFKFEIVERDNCFYVVKKKPQYPKTYHECYKILDAGEEEVLFDGATASEEFLFDSFIKLKRCRDAYWKIAGEQMGLGKPWKPDWLDIEQDKYVLFTHNNVICSNRYVLGHNILAFPTEEMRDAFYENFKDWIEQCKELL
jgi:hypothetical protein